MPIGKYPTLTCRYCGETKGALHFPKLHGYYQKYKTTDERRYDKVCKTCRKPLKPGEKREDVKPVMIRSRSYGGKRKKKPNKKRPRKGKFDANESRRVRKVETRIQSLRYLAEKGCEDCGERDPRVLEYDHINPKKKLRGIARLITDGFGWTSPTLKREIRKCRVLCANCHRRHTVLQQGYYAHEDIQREIGILAARFKFDL